MMTVAMLTLGWGGVAVLTDRASAYADTASMESQFIAAMNAARQANGQQPYAVAYDLTSVARSHSQQMASRHSLYHNPNLTTDVSNWQAVGENVGEGPDVQDIHDAFMRSPEHRANILDHDFTQVGVGVSVDGDGTIWVTEDFREPMSSASTTTTSHHSSSSPSQPTTAPAAPATSGTAAATPVSAAPVAQAAPKVSPRAQLLQRLHTLRHQQARSRAGDPVAQAFDYVRTLSQLAG
jgi:hypothetical protein